MSAPREPARRINVTHRHAAVSDIKRRPVDEAIVLPLYKPKTPPAPVVTPSGRGGRPATPKTPPAPSPTPARSGRPGLPAPKVKTVPVDAVVVSRADWKKITRVIDYAARARGLK